MICALCKFFLQDTDVQCDPETACPDETTCCQLGSGDWGCCPMPKAVCCDDKIHCCPEGTNCNVEAGTCEQGGTSLAFPWFSKFSATKFAKVRFTYRRDAVDSRRDGTEDQLLTACFAFVVNEQWHPMPGPSKKMRRRWHLLQTGHTSNLGLLPIAACHMLSGWSPLLPQWFQM